MNAHARHLVSSAANYFVQAAISHPIVFHGPPSALVPHKDFHPTDHPNPDLRNKPIALSPSEHKAAIASLRSEIAEARDAWITLAAEAFEAELRNHHNAETIGDPAEPPTSPAKKTAKKRPAKK